MYFSKETYLPLCLGLLCTALLGACGSVPNAARGHEKASAKFRVEQLRKQREKTLHALWNGKSYASLVEAMGPPSIVMDVPGSPSQITAKIYGVLDPATQCVDTFTVATQGMESTVNGYFCR